MVTRYRSYKGSENKSRLLAWIDHKCKECKRFINKRNNIGDSLCSRCRLKRKLRQNLSRKEVYHVIRKYIWNSANKLKVGDIIG